MTTFRAIATALSAGLLSFVLPERADACSCDFNAWGVLMPGEGDRVPTNARIWVRTDESVKVFAPSGEEVAVDSDELDLAVDANTDLKLLVLTPREPLEPGEGYSIELRNYPQVLFEVIDEVDTTAPDAPKVVDYTTDSNDDDGNSCGTYRGGTISLESEGLVFALRDQDELTESPLGGTAHSLKLSYEPGESSFSFALPCGDTWPGSETVALRFASFDVAGNLSPASEPESFKRPKESGLCSVARPGAARSTHTALPFMALALLFFARRCLLSLSRVSPTAAPCRSDRLRV